MHVEQSGDREVRPKDSEGKDREREGDPRIESF